MRISNMIGAFLTICGFLFGLIGNILADWIGKALETNPTLIILFIAAVTVVVVLAIAAKLLQPRYVHVIARMDMPRMLDTAEHCRDYARQGLVVFVSNYRPFPPRKFTQEDIDRWGTAADQLDLQTLDLENSNLATVIRAVKSHACNLTHCWLISTRESCRFVPALVKYLREQAGVNCQFFGDQTNDYVIDLNTNLVTGVTKDVVEKIFHEAEFNYGIKDVEMVADFTPCPRNMTLGMILACIDKRRTVQFVEAKYDAAGNPVPPLVPYLYDFEAVVRDEA
jgi:uncharacterized membrane protein YeaQ/YmgE (transglycosylase-associated protein family)